MVSFSLKLHGVCVYKFVSAVVDQPKHVIRCFAIIFSRIKYENQCTFASTLSMVTCHSSNEPAFNEEQNNLNWKPVDDMVTELWLFSTGIA